MQGTKRPLAHARPRFPIAQWPRDGKALEVWSKNLTSYLMVPGDGNNHLYGGGKNHRARGVTPLLSVAPSTHALTPTGVSRHQAFEI